MDTNPYKSPEVIAETSQPLLGNGLTDPLNRAYCAATHGLFFLPGIAVLISLFLLWRIEKRRSEFTPDQKRIFNIAFRINLSVVLVLGVSFAILVALDYAKSRGFAPAWN